MRNRVAKNIVVCCDGTGNEFGGTNSNVVKLYQTLVADQRQTVYYHPGIGTMAAPTVATKLGKQIKMLWAQAFGAGLEESTGDGYKFLMDNFEEGDSVYLFGFSRGAYTARVLAAMLHMFGLLRKGNDVQFRYIWKMTKHKLSDYDFDVAAEFKETFSRNCKVHFVGVWDTVSSVGWIYDPIKLPYTRNNPDIAIARHALSIDERRCMFRQNLLGDARGGQDIKQIWFAGVHSDVGGGYPESESGLAKVSLDWMIREAKAAGLIVSAERQALILGQRHGTGSALEKVAPFITENANADPHESLTGGWWFLEIWPRRRWDVSVSPAKYRWEFFPMGRRRHIPPSSIVHPSVIERMKSSGYSPPNLPSDYQHGS
jgi:uncharacterized protein (DUF2235 family)